MSEEKPFNVLTAELDKTNLIEASAGTGKTYSIAILVLRMLLEKEIPIEKILVVTFTEDAAAELRSRCAMFIRKALVVLQNNNAGKEDQDDNIKTIVNKGNRETYKRLLTHALLDVDKATIGTIHGFCRQTLSEFAFETGQAFGLELHTDIDPIIDRHLANYWREHVTGKEIDDIKAAELDKYNLYKRGIKLALTGRDLAACGDPLTAFEHQLNEIIPAVKASVEEYLRTNRILTFDDMIGSLHKKRKFEHLKQLMQQKYNAVFVDEFQDTDEKQYEIFHDLFQNKKNNILFYIGDPKQSIYSFRNADLDVYKRAKENILKGGGRILSMNLNFRSSTELIDKCNVFFEQSESFHPFTNGSGIHYIAVKAGENHSYAGIKKGNGAVEPFVIYQNNGTSLRDLSNHVRYLLTEDQLTLNGKKIQPEDIAIIVRLNNDCRNVKKLLSNAGIPSVVIDDTNIFTSPEAKSYEYLLKALLETSVSNINAFLMEPITGFTEKTIESLQTDQLVSLFKQWRLVWEKHGLPAMLKEVFEVFGIQSANEADTTGGHRSLSNFQQLTDLLQKQSTNQQLTPVQVFYFLRQQNKNQGKEQASQENNEFTLRLESDEAAVKIMTIHKSKGLEFPIVLLANLELKNSPIHNRIFFSVKSDNINSFVKYRKQDQANDAYRRYLNLYKQQAEEENRRLIYVAITRAKYHVALFVKERAINSNGTYNQNTVGSIHAYLDGLVDKNLLDAFSHPLPNNNKQYKNSNAGQSTEPSLSEYPSLSFPDKNYHKISYSFISAGHASGFTLPVNTIEEGTYQHFLFKQLPAGTRTGHLLHGIFEHIDFMQENSWEGIVQQSLMIHMRSKSDDQTFRDNILKLLRIVVETLLPSVTFSLKDIPRSKRLNEFEFNFHLPEEIDLGNLENILDDSSRSISAKRSVVKGMMNGFIDMVFEHEGKYYILDWKSNYLGDSFEDYSEEAIKEAMNMNNYHLQYMIYTLALHKYLQSTIDTYEYNKHFGGVFYVFLRGIQPEHATTTNGIYFVKPNQNELDSTANALGVSLSLVDSAAETLKIT